jgi:hypothetical protein
MKRGNWAGTALLIVLLVLAILFAQSPRNCEIPGSTWIPCIWGKQLKRQSVPGPYRRVDRLDLLSSNLEPATEHGIPW